MADEPERSGISKSALRAMIAIALAILFVAIYANVQRLRRNQIEKANFIPARSTPAVR